MREIPENKRLEAKNKIRFKSVCYKHMKLKGSKLSVLARTLKLEVRIVLEREPEVNLQHDTVVILSSIVQVAEGQVAHSVQV